MAPWRTETIACFLALTVADCEEREQSSTTDGSEPGSMILFKLRCAGGHHFEGWFCNGDGFEAQQKAGEISCPECGETKIEKALMAPRLGKSHGRFRRLAVGLGVTEDPGGKP
jgi:hypothetical protein